MLLILRFSESGSSLVTLDLISDDHMIGYAAIFSHEYMINYNKIRKKFLRFHAYDLNSFSLPHIILILISGFELLPLKKYNGKNMVNNAFYVFYARLQILAIAL